MKFSLFNESNFIEGSALHAFQEINNKKSENDYQKYVTLGSSINFLINNKILDCPNYLKIDVDGLEQKIILNSDTILNNPRLETILIEISDEVEKKFQITNYIQKYGFDKVKISFPSNNNKYINGKNYIFQRKK